MEKIKLKSVYFKKLKGLKDVELEFAKPLTAVMGVNGAGKTTVIHALACIYKPDGKGENHKFPEFFVPNTDAQWTGSEFDVINEVEGKDHNLTILPARTYGKAYDRWNPRYDDRPKRNTYYIGIDTCLPEIEKNTATSRIQYTSKNRTDGVSKKTLEIAAYVLNKDYDCLIDNKYDSKHFLGVSTRHGLKYSSLSMGTGEQRTIKIIEKVLNAEPYSLILIDEIDLLLHVCALRRLIEKLYCIAADRHLQIVFTTHSLEVLSMTQYIGLQYLDTITKPDGSSVTMVYDKPSSDIIMNITGQMASPISIGVEDEFSQAIIKTIVRKHGISSKVSITKFGAAKNAFTIAAGLMMVGKNSNHNIFVLDGDVYTTDAEKMEQIKKVYTGTEDEIDAKRAKAVSCIIQYNLSIGVTPEQFMYNLLLKCSEDNEITQMARVINAVDDPHKLISNIAIQLNDSIDSTVSRIVSMIEHSEEWITYIAPITSWINENKNV